jgi:hypothetical protein
LFAQRDMIRIRTLHEETNFPRAQYTETLDIIQEFSQHRGYRFLRLDGTTDRVRRELDVRAFNAEASQYFMYLISTRAGGQGINLATADAVVLYDTCLNPQVDLQVRWPSLIPLKNRTDVAVAKGLFSY